MMLNTKTDPQTFLIGLGGAMAVGLGFALMMEINGTYMNWWDRLGYSALSAILFLGAVFALQIKDKLGRR